MKKGALEGLKVIDLTRALAGPYSSMLLADQGATVIKVEAPDIGDGTRRMPPFAPDMKDREPYGGYFQSINRNKRSIVVDLKSGPGKAVVKRLVKDADVLVENFRSGVMEGLELSYETLAEINPKLVYAAVRGFGDPRTGESPYSSWPAYDVIAQAMGGMMSVTGQRDGEPLKVGPGVGDLIPGTLAAFGIMSAVFHANRTGEGQFLDVAMYDAVLSFSERIVPQYAYTGEIPGTEGNAHPGLCPFGVFQCKDGWVSIACPGDNFWSILANAMDRSDMIADERYQHNWNRVEHMDEVISIVTDWTRQHTKASLKNLLGGKIPFGPVNNAEDLFQDEHVKARNMLVEIPQPGSTESYAITNTPIRMTKTQGGVRTRAPLLGEHTDDVLREVGYSEEEIDQLKEEGSIQ
jgi:crotonobetainyl-CoA:carnitine CoA-transferase CaiB-like acyl-CoA transferase